jgi:hypothetical protein
MNFQKNLGELRWTGAGGVMLLGILALVALLLLLPEDGRPTETSAEFNAKLKKASPEELNKYKQHLKNESAYMEELWSN